MDQIGISMISNMASGIGVKNLNQAFGGHLRSCGNTTTLSWGSIHISHKGKQHFPVQPTQEEHKIEDIIPQSRVGFTQTNKSIKWIELLKM